MRFTRRSIGTLLVSAAALVACKTTQSTEGSDVKDSPVSSNAHQLCDFEARQYASQFLLPARRAAAYQEYYAQCMARHGGDQIDHGGDTDSGELPLIRNRTRKSTQHVISHLSRIPWEVRSLAQCIAVVSKDHVGWGLSGGELGAGLVSCRTASGEWSAPSYLSLGGITLGPAVGFLNDDTTFIFTRQTAGQVYRSNFTFDAGVYAVAGSANAELSADTDGCIRVKIFGEFQRHCTLAITDLTGLGAGANVRGVLLRHMSGFLGGGNVGRNARVYGSGIRVDQILSMPGSQAPDVVRPWVNALNEYAP